MPTGVRYQDAMLRHQLMLERVKGYYYRDFNKYLNRLAKEVRAVLNSQGNLSKLTRRQLDALQAEIDRRQAPIWIAWREDMVARGRQLMLTDRRLAGAILAATQEATGRAAKTAKAFTDLASDPDTLWASILSEPLGANGQTYAQMLEHFTDSASTRIVNSVAHGYANNLDGRTVAENITGLPATNTGLFRILRNQSRAVIATGFQHVSTETHADVQSATYNKYRWVSVLDDRTTDICRGRHGKIFDYKTGPKPPAHFHCRSTIVPAAAPVTQREIQSNSDEWLAEQLAKTVLGVVGTRLHNTTDIIRTSHLRPMTIGELGNSAGLMTGK